MDFRKKTENIWYYYKYYIIAAIVAILVIVICVKNCASRKKCDVDILFMTHGWHDAVQSLQLEAFFDEYADDINGDGIANTQVTTIGYGVTAEENNSANAARSANLAAGRAVLFLLDEQNRSELSASGFLAEGVDITSALSEIQGFSGTDDKYYLYIRTCDDKKYQSDKGYALRYNAAKSVVEEIKAKL